MTGSFSILIVAVILFALFAAIIAGARKKETKGGEWPFYAKPPLSQPELILYSRLTQALPGHIILAQVQLSRLLGVKKGHNQQSWLNRINRMSADFVVCNRDSSVLCAIELDDASHQRKDRQIADDKKDSALASAGVRLVRWNVKSLPDLKAIQAEVMPAAVQKQQAVKSTRQ